MPCKPRDGTRTRHGPRSISAPRRRRPYVGQSPDDDSDRTQRTKGVDAHVAAWSTAPHRTRPSPSGQPEQRGGAKEPAGKAMSSRETKPTNPRIPKAAAGARGWICSPAFLNLLCRCSAPTPRQEPGSRRCLEGNCMTVDQVCRSVRHSQGQPRPPCSTRRPNPASRIMTKRIDHGILGHHAHADTTHEIRPQYARQMDARGTHLNPKSECVPNIFAL